MLLAQGGKGAMHSQKCNRTLTLKRPNKRIIWHEKLKDTYLKVPNEMYKMLGNLYVKNYNKPINYFS
jgi:hypothetical protein